MSWPETLMSGVVSGVVVVFFQQHFVWKTQERFTRKKSAYEDAVDALAMHENDAMDLELQATNKGIDGVKHEAKFRPETHIKVAQARMLVRAHFSPAAADSYWQVFTEKLSKNTVPNTEFYLKRDQAIMMLADELDPPGWSPSWIGKRQR